MSFLTAKIAGLVLLSGTVTAVATSSIIGSRAGKLPCKNPIILNKKEKQKCYKLFTDRDSGEFFVCPNKEQTNDPVFWLWWTKEGRGRISYLQISKIKVEVSDKSIKVEFPEFSGKSLTMKEFYVSILGTDKDKLTQLNDLNLKTSCKIETNQVKISLNCGEGKYKQQLLHPQYYRVP
ncbi:hypothetical protein OVS_03505 [Mycoplasma ovis str. Michigan]|uniref:Uncharacterized protein n=1 Tax=Mycoplasma ovis str. Michigan TaxID=1415773 RepID=A0ABM5P1Z7_9MOLU|nr:hypothetical protein [Mycoplasma ovis]AHC40450.1 hypothetical protein OVS_03505 [Mycoplasma ovis str. Michigan]